MCNCIEKIEQMMTEKMSEEYPETDGWEVMETVEFQNKILMFGEEESVLVLKNETLGKVRRGKQIRKFTPSVRPGYCPYCGEKLVIR